MGYATSRMGRKGRGTDEDVSGQVYQLDQDQATAHVVQFCANGCLIL